MVYQPLFISNYTTGLQNDIEPFLLMDDAFPELENAYLFRGRIKRRQGFKSFGRFQRDLTAQALGNAAGTSFSVNIFSHLSLEATASLKEGDITVHVGAPGTSTFVEPATPDGTLVGSGFGTTGTINYATGALVLNFSGAIGASAVTIDFSYYPGLPAMGLFQRELPALGFFQTVGFDTVYAYLYNNTNSAWEEWVPGTTWTGSNSQFFWTFNYWVDAFNSPLLWATNFNKLDPIRYNNGSAWTNFAPAITSVPAASLFQARIIIPFKGRLVMLNTWEGLTATGAAGATNYPQRCRFSQVGSPLDVTAWLTFPQGKGGFIDAPTNQQIVSAAFIRDQLVVYFENSTWNLRYTGEPNLPFIWERVDSELGSESTFSPVLFDKGVLAVGKLGITTSTGNSVERIDEKIPDEVFNFHNGNDGALRVYGIRDYVKQLVYWAFPNDDPTRVFPNRMLVFDYERGSWSFFNDSFTCFGRNLPFNDIRWKDLPKTSWEEADFAWNDARLQSGYPDIIAGNQEGYTFVLNQQTVNDPSLYISAITPGTPPTITVTNHNLQTKDFVTFTGILGTSSILNDITYQVVVVDANNFKILTYDSTNGIFIDVVLPGGSTYLGGGEVTTVQNFNVRTKMFNFFEAGKGNYLGYIDFLCPITQNGEFSCNVYGGYNTSTPLNDGTDTFFNTQVSTQGQDGVIQEEDQVWQRFFCYVRVPSAQIQLFLSDVEMVTPELNANNWQLSAMILWVESGGRLTK